MNLISTKYNSLKIILAGLFCISIFAIHFSFAHALTISPARVEVSGNPGQVLVGEYTLINEEEKTKVFYSSFENFEAQGETGSPNFVFAEEGLATWIDSQSEIILGPREVKKLQYSIIIPDNADPGGHFAAIFWGTSKPEVDEGGQVSVGAKIGVLILLRVSGDIEEGGGILDFKIFDKDEQELGEQRFFTTLPVDFSYRFQNTGGDRIKPASTVTIKNMFGLQTDVLDANKYKGNILPDSIRKFELSWNGTDDIDDEQKVERLEKPVGFVSTVKHQWRHFAFGRYTANLELIYGVGNEMSSDSKLSFFVLPWQLLIVILLSLFVIILFLKLYNKMIIKRAQRINDKFSDVVKNDSDTQNDSDIQQSGA